MALPQSVIDLVENEPVEDLLLTLYRDKLPDIEVASLFRSDQSFPVVLVRRVPGFAEGEGDPRFLDAALVAVHALCEGIEADAESALLSEACRVILRDAWMQRTTYPGKGQISSFELIQAPRRTTDWATATGPVQYADLPAGVVRYEAQYAITVRRPTRR